MTNPPLSEVLDACQACGAEIGDNWRYLPNYGWVTGAESQCGTNRTTAHVTNDEYDAALLRLTMKLLELNWTLEWDHEIGEYVWNLDEFTYSASGELLSSRTVDGVSNENYAQAAVDAAKKVQSSSSSPSPTRPSGS